MLCAECGTRPVIFRRTRCLECMAGKPMRESHPRQYCREDHAGKRARLRQAIEAAIQSGAIVPGGRHDRS